MHLECLDEGTLAVQVIELLGAAEDVVVAGGLVRAGLPGCVGGVRHEYGRVAVVQVLDQGALARSRAP